MPESRRDADHTFLFLDHYKLLNKEHGVRATIVEARNEDEAWQKWSNRWAIANFGLKLNSTVEEVKEHFGDTVEVVNPHRILVID